jgi:hypothetical protein
MFDNEIYHKRKTSMAGQGYKYMNSELHNCFHFPVRKFSSPFQAILSISLFDNNKKLKKKLKN